MLRCFYRPFLARRVCQTQMKRKFENITDPHSIHSMATVQLTPREKQLKSLLLDVAAHIDRAEGEAKSKDPVVLRWAGGWVRDKLLGIPSHDIDTAINSMTGFAFASKLREFCDKPENVEKHSLGPSDIGNLHKIAQNPEKSKHLETVTTRILGFDVDFVNLRKETYAEDSRNPQMEFGTAEEDALRRDATVNALFYNLNTGEVEDLTGGLPDMEAKLIRTPMEPFQTFMDDPLRVLRLVRFASRLTFSIDPKAERVMGDPRVLDALRLKISRERVGVEVEKMLTGRQPTLIPCLRNYSDISIGQHPCDALRFIDRLGLYHTIFTDSADSQMPQPDISNWTRAYSCLDDLEVHKSPRSIYELLVTSQEARYFAWNIAAIIPWVQIPDPPAPKAGKLPTPYATTAAREGIKAPNRLSDVITAACRNREKILELKGFVNSKDARMNERDRVGMAIREWDARGGHWRLQVLAALLDDVLTRPVTESISPPSSIEDKKPKPFTGIEELLREWQEFLDHLQELDLMDAPSIKRLVDGRQLSQALGIKPGKWMTAAMDVCMAWQLRNPGVTDTAGAIEEVRKRSTELGIPT